LQKQSHFSLLLRVRYAECDAQQVVFNARYADYVDVAITEYMRCKIGGFQTLLEQGLDNQVVNLNMDFRSSACFDDILEVQVDLLKLGNSSYSFAVNMYQFNSKKLVIEAQITYVLVDSKHYQKTPLSQQFKEQLSKKTSPVMVNQTGAALV
jgi:acyl-CoA thioester hydrolase